AACRAWATTPPGKAGVWRSWTWTGAPSTRCWPRGCRWATTRPKRETPPDDGHGPARTMSLPEPAAPHTRGEPLSLVLFRLAHSGTSPRVSIGDLLTALGDRALAALMFV